VVALTDSSGSVQDQYAYDPYGNTTSVQESVPNPFRYIGGIWDSQTGLYKLGARYYDPTVGRFTQTDPTCGWSISRYTYAGDDPASDADPSGAITLRQMGCMAWCVAAKPGGGIVFSMPACAGWLHEPSNTNLLKGCFDLLYDALNARQIWHDCLDKCGLGRPPPSGGSGVGAEVTNAAEAAGEAAGAAAIVAGVVAAAAVAGGANPLDVMYAL
jgi:RHS repeat-associated protein